MMKKARKAFFSEEKKQKTLLSSPLPPAKSRICQWAPGNDGGFGGTVSVPPILMFLAFLIFASCASAQVPPVLDQLHRADGTQILPDRFLREWDPITILFRTDRGPKAGGPEDAPTRFVTMTPQPPGAWTWLGPRTLQFRPAETWTPLQRITVTTGASATRLVPLLPVPVESGPADTPSGISGLDSVALTFSQPVDAASLARLMTIEVAPQPGTPASGTQTLGAADFSITPQERNGRAAPETYLIALHQPIADGRIATLHLRLADEPGLDDPIFSLKLHSAAPFKLDGINCGGQYSGAQEDGVRVCNPPGSEDPPRAVELNFSASPAALDVVKARNALRFTPPVDDLATTASDTTLTVSGKFQADTLYELSISAGALSDSRGRTLSSAFTEKFRFVAGAPALAWDVSQGIAERLGAQMVPLRGHGYDRADLRIHAIDPLSRDFWPFPRAGLATSDTQAPPLPGKEPGFYTGAAPIPDADMVARLQALGTPAFSALMDLPIRRGGTDAKFGLDLSSAFSAIAGAQQPGTYLLGLRTVDGTQRQWARVQITDLSLTAIEEASHVRFIVTALATAQPVAGAQIELDGTRDNDFSLLTSGTTAADGSFTLRAPVAFGRYGQNSQLGRIVVRKGADTLVLEPTHAPPRYAEGAWSEQGGTWLNWITADPGPRREPARTLCHVFTERPIYRPEEPVLIAGMIRTYRAGTFDFAAGHGDVLVTGPNEQEWHLPATLDEIGGFHIKFDAKTEATGDYQIAWVPDHGAPCGEMRVKKEAYRLPTFEVLLNGPPHASLDAPFDVKAVARFFAGGLVSDRPVTWRVTQSPYAWSPPGRDGFVFSSDSRFSGDTVFRSTPVLTRDAKTDAGGSAQLTLDPTLEPTAQPRQYLVEATVTGDDDIQVRGVQTITALPPFVLGLKMPRYIAKPGAIDAGALALDGDGKPVLGLKLTARLIHRQWNSILQASDFAQGAAKYDTQVLDETVTEQHFVAGAEAEKLHFAVKEAGVYVVELEATDKAGRTQKVREDLFMAGDTPVTWSRAPSQTITITADHDTYDPGQTANLIIQSPFQTARALMITEQPEGRFTYDWVEIAHGYGRYAVPIRTEQMPRLAVHALLMRGRLPGTPPSGAPFDLGKPVTLAATKWIAVTPVENEVKVSFEAPAEARPAQMIDLVVRLTDAHGHPLAGEATVWLVDQAVLSLAKEQKLDPLPAFIVDRPSRMAAYDTRSMAFGILPLSENPGGAENGEGGMANISVRKNFTPVPFYAPRVKFGPDGIARLHVHLPDSLTVFMLRAKAVSGAARFGFGTGELRVRLPVVAQAALPRFLRTGDRFSAGLIARVVEGAGGAGREAIHTTNLKLDGPATQDFNWDGTHPARIETALSVPDLPYGTSSARIQLAVQRRADQAGDAVQLDLPILPDRPLEHRRTLLTTGAGPLMIPPPPEPLRPAPYQRRVTLATDPEIVRLIAGMNFLLRSPTGGTEQKMAAASAELALLPFTPLIDAAGLQNRLSNDVADAFKAIKRATDDRGLVAFWPGVSGTIWMTADAYRLTVAAARLGLPVDKAMADRMATVLTASLRSDYPHLVSTAEAFERVDALAALADGGKVDAAYAAELARRAQFLSTEGVAYVATALSRLPHMDARLMREVMEVLWSRVNLLSRQGVLVYAGLTDQPQTKLILPSEARSLAAVLRAVAAVTPSDSRLPLLRAALLGLADGQGWGTTNATAAALRALAGAWRTPASPIQATIGLPGTSVQGTLDANHPLLQGSTDAQGPATVQSAPNLAVLASTDLVQAEPGAKAHAVQSGLVVSRHFYRVLPNQPLTRIDPQQDGTYHFRIGDVIEEVDDLQTVEDRTNVALHLPLAAGMEPLNPALATAPAEATPSAPPTVPPAYVRFGDDEALNVWLTFARGTATLRMRMRATFAGVFTAPAAWAEALYNPGVMGASSGAAIIVEK